MPKIVSRILNSSPLLIKQIASETSRLIATDNATIISLAQGTPNLAPFSCSLEAMKEVINKEKFPYTDVPGTIEAREIAAKFVNEYYSKSITNPYRLLTKEESESITYSPSFTSSNTIITAGAAQSVYNSLALSIESIDDIVLSPLPAYGLYKHQTTLLGGTFIPIPTQVQNQFIPTIEELNSMFNLYGNKIKSLVLCFPNNPTGAVLSAKQAKEMAQFLDAKLEQYEKEEEKKQESSSNSNGSRSNSSSSNSGFTIVLDEVYIGITPYHHTILNYASPRLLSSIILVLSCSKGLGASPGLRCGWLTSFNPFLIQQMIKIQMACTANASILSQISLISNLNYIMKQPTILNEVVLKHYQLRTNYAVKRLNEIGAKWLNGSILASIPISTFYVIANFSSLPSVETDVEIQELFRDMYKNGSEKIGVAVVPGCAFDLDSKLKLVRLSCAVDMEQLEKAMEIIEEAVQKCVEKAKIGRN